MYMYIVAGPTRRRSVGLARVGVCMREGGWLPPFVYVVSPVVAEEGAASRGSSQPWGGRRERSPGRRVASSCLRRAWLSRFL